MKNAITITLNGGLKNWGIDFVQHLEKEFDEALTHNGFSRATTTKSDDLIEINYRQFAECL